MADFNFTEEDIWTGSFDFDFGSQVTIYRLINGINNSFNSIWADSSASLTSGAFYVGRQNDLTIISNNNGQVAVKDYYSFTQKGASGDTLEAEDMVDINVVG